MTNAQTVLLGKGIDADGKIIDIRGERFYRTGRRGVANSIQAVLDAGLFRVPTYLQGEGRVAAVHAAQAEGDVQLALQDSIWHYFGDSYAERLTLFDQDGILGKRGELYAVSTQKLAFFSNDPQRIRAAVDQKKTSENDVFVAFEQEEVNRILKALKERNLDVFKEQGWIREESHVFVYDTFHTFDEDSSQNGFLDDMPAYVLVEPVQEARKGLSGEWSLDKQRENKSLIFDFGGRKKLGDVIDALEKVGYNKFGSSYGDFFYINQGRVVVLEHSWLGVLGDSTLGFVGCSLGISPESLAQRRRLCEVQRSTEHSSLDTKVQEKY